MVWCGVGVVWCGVGVVLMGVGALSDAQAIRGDIYEKLGGTALGRIIMWCRGYKQPKLLFLVFFYVRDGF